MKRNKTTNRGQRARGTSPYHKYEKRECDYSAMYRRNPHLAEARRRAAAIALGRDTE